LAKLFLDNEKVKDEWLSLNQKVGELETLVHTINGKDSNNRKFLQQKHRDNRFFKVIQRTIKFNIGKCLTICSRF